MTAGPRATGAATPLGPSTVGLLTVAVVAVSFSGPLMAASAVPALAIAFWRNGFAALLLAPVALLRRRAELLATTARERWLVLAAAFFLALHFATWIASLSLTSVAASTALVCLQVAWVVGYDRLRGRRVPRVAVIGLVVAFAGVLVITGVDVQVSTRALVGDLLALAGSAAVAAYTVIGGEVRRTVATTTYTFGCYGLAALLLLAACLIARVPISGYDARDWGLLVLVTLTAQLLGHSVFNLLLSTISPMLVSLTLLLEIPGAALVAAVLLGQVPPLGVFAGLALILLGTAVVVLTGTTGPDPVLPADP